MLILSFIYNNGAEAELSTLVKSYSDTVHLGHEYLRELPDYLGEVAVALLPIFVFFLLFQIFSLKLKKRPLIKIIIGIVYTYVGLVLFLTGVNVGFSSLGYVLGQTMVEKNLKFLLIPLAMLMGWFIINAEPAVHVLNKSGLKN